MTIPEITVIIPTRHRTPLLHTTLLSLSAARSEAERSRAVSGVRLLVVDDAPDNDETRQLVSSLDRVDYARVPVHDGRRDPGAAILLGLQHVDTEFHTLFGDDDMVLPRHFVAAASWLRQGADVVSSSFHVVDSQLRVTRDIIIQPATLDELILGVNRLNDGSFVRSELFRATNLDVTLEAHMLGPAWAQLLMDERTFEIVEEPTWLYRRHGTNISRSSLTSRDLELRARVSVIISEMVAGRLDVVRRLYGTGGSQDLEGSNECDPKDFTSEISRLVAAARLYASVLVDG